MNLVLKALEFRHACKKFDPDKKISLKDLDTILECALLSPTSFGMEAWKFLVLASDNEKLKLRPACWNQPQITDASHVVVILAKPGIVDFNHDHVKKAFARRNLPEDMTSAYLDRYRSHMEQEVLPKMSLYAWCSKQCYIALANIMTAAASMEIDSCPIEGFEKAQVEKAMQINTDQYEVAVIVALGYRHGEQTPRLRFDKSRLIEYR